jgi:asparagine synthetase B (glutamine-hydrolysing)
VSAIVAIVGGFADCESILHRGAEASAARGPICAQWIGARGAIAYQGHAPEQNFCVTRDSVCVALGWPYEIDAATGAARRLFAADFASRLTESALDLSRFRRSIFGQFVVLKLCLKTGKMLVVRDVLGSLPFHWSQFSDGSVHASDIRQVAAATEQPLRLSVSALRRYHQTLSLPAAVDLYQGVHLHAPGVVSCFQQGAVAQTLQAAPSIFELMPEFSSRFATNDATEQVSEAVKTSMSMALSDARTVLSLSGGMDSALLLLSAKALTQDLDRDKLAAKFQSASCVFPGLSCDESSRIDTISKLVGAEHHSIVCKQPNFSHWQSQLFSATDYIPFPANQMGLQIARFASAQGCTQVFDGNGGDELFDWSLLDLAQCAISLSDWKQFLRAVMRTDNGSRYRAIRHACKRGLLARVARPINAPILLAQKMLSPSIDRAFYLAAEQIAGNSGVALYSPLRDLRLMQMCAPWLPMGSFHQGQRRGLQANAIFQMSGASIRLNRADKVNFDEFARVPHRADETPGMEGHESRVPDLGIEKLHDFAGLMPRFLQHKVDVERILLSP